MNALASIGSSGPCHPAVPCAPAANISSPTIRALDTRVRWRDTVGGWLVRWGIGRMRYRVEPGLYRLGAPDRSSPVLVTANYKLTVDTLRRSLAGQNVWVLVLDTGGVNVWCAAGKGTFGTKELVHRIQATDLASTVDHRRVVVPQLGAVGVAAHDVKPATGFAVTYGPVHARDIPAYLANRMRATEAMRQVRFNWWDRVVLAPIELVGAAKPAVLGLLVLTALHVIVLGHSFAHALVAFMPFLGAILTGGLLAPLLLPWLPFRSFALKGACLGITWAVVCLRLFPTGLLERAGTVLIIVVIASYMTLNFTGATTFTNLAGVRLEVRYAVPALISAAGAGLLFTVLAAIT